ncbi:nitroreductase family deazaflavin-dependent oxidoreductase [Myxococcota bacterium]|nr:nitroreductase family deazaflavin-dependent oxidoreductase [Myxococcota bacterium]
MAENPMTEQEFKRLRQFIKPFSRLNSWVYRLTGGRLMGKFQGRPVVLITMKGAKSGAKRTIPLMYVPYGDGVIIVASQGGAPKSPVWYANLLANPDIEAQYKGQKMQLRARQVDDDEKAQVWPTCVEHYPPFADYQSRTDRNIPVFVCEPRTS